MSRERWGTLSVKDHLDVTGLTADVLLYDRLVFPVPDDDEERRRWSEPERGWNPDKLDERLCDLGDLAVRAPWNEERRARFRAAFEDQPAAGPEPGLRPIGLVDAFQMTRMLLVDDTKNRTLERPASATRVVAFPAYHSESALAEDFLVEAGVDGPPSTRAAAIPGGREEAVFAFVLGRKLLFPAPGSRAWWRIGFRRPPRTDEEALKRAAALSTESESFRRRRRDFYDWQDEILRDIALGEIRPADAVNEMEKLVEDYNRAVKKAVRDVQLKFAFALATAGAAAAGAVVNPIAGVGAFLSLARFWTFDRKPVIDAGEAGPAAMFHDARKTLGWH
jgi:hypothetical protein